jgi:hypothetical protein
MPSATTRSRIRQKIKHPLVPEIVEAALNQISVERVDGSMKYSAVICAIFFAGLSQPAHAAPGDGPYDIMRPESGTPGVVRPYQSPRRTPQNIKPLRSLTPPEPRNAITPPPIVVPQTGQVVPSQPISPQGYVPPGQRETFGDRAIRCTHQAGIAGLPADQRSAYMGSCLNQ